MLTTGTRQNENSSMAYTPTSDADLLRQTGEELTQLLSEQPSLRQQPQLAGEILHRHADLFVGARVVAARVDERLGSAGVGLIVVLAPSGATSADIPEAEALAARCGLTPREATVALQLAKRHSNGEIARHLGVSPHTVRHHTERVLAKLGVHSRREVAAAICAKLAD